MTATGPSAFPMHLLAPADPAKRPLPPAANPAPGVRLLRAAEYAVPDGNRPLVVDLWLPEDAGEPLPLIVFVHGGGWRTGQRDDLGPRFRSWRPGPFARLARAGFAVACPDYRLSGEAAYPAQRDDLADALTWLHTRAGELGLDTSRTVLWGESAGGHLAALTALTHSARTGTATVTGCVTWYAPTDLTALAADLPPGAYDAEDPGSYEALMLGGPPAGIPEIAHAASPVTHVTAQAPPFLILHGTADAVVPARQAVRLARALHDAGAGPDLRLLTGGNHLWVGLTDTDVEDCFTRTLDFARSRTAAADADARPAEGTPLP
ncbi:MULTISPECIES: alpha/beta hydrolase [Streptomyces]|uniref:alpha/beta hydrolase n=1 Tax=Streptomyces TaxID=1883 RepID=UPI00163C2C68|nr:MULTISPECIES: alpha/beta hydrolase [Streptomyces]MBC2879345.1 alpha/beta hydrolase [Streptomyces sp. TYQ1024]UBI40060.1 alpha/beta hydrolase [Streptomyces mobaraensis]UKW32640.1 alpha/beta hydrolase [Streptomyces sp. TYQ1024]